MLHQGVAAVAIPSLVCDHLESVGGDLTLAMLDRELKGPVFRHYRNWCQQQGKRVSACSHRFDSARFHREAWNAPPELSSIYKAAVVKSMMYWASAYLTEFAEAARDEHGALRAHCAYSLAMWQHMIDTRPAFFTPEDGASCAQYGKTFLLFYQRLASINRQRVDGRANYKITPKFHSMLHFTDYVAHSLRNPRPLGASNLQGLFGVATHQREKPFAFIVFWGIKRPRS